MGDEHVDSPTLWNGAFKKGDKVRLIKPWKYGDNRATDKQTYPQVGDIGTIQGEGTQRGRRGLNYLGVSWTNANGENIGSKWTDVDCFEHVDALSKEELREVMESLGGNHEPIGTLDDAVTLLKMHEAGDLTDSQTVAALKIDLGVKPRTDVSLVLGNAISMATKEEISTQTLVNLVETFAEL